MECQCAVHSACLVFCDQAADLVKRDVRAVKMHEGAHMEELVELVDDFGRYGGEVGMRGAHSPPGKRHRAFSVFL